MTNRPKGSEPNAVSNGLWTRRAALGLGARGLAGAGFLGGLGALSACGDDDAESSSPGTASASNAGSTTSVTALFPRQTPDADLAPLWAAIALGYYEEEGLDVTVQTTTGSPDAVNLLNAGQGDIALPGAEAIIQGRAQGMDIRDFFTWVQRQIYSVGAVEGRDVATVADLEGKSVGVLSLASSTVPLVQSLLVEAGLDPVEAVTFVPLGVGGQATAAVQSGQVDAVAYHDTQLLQFERAGIGIEPFPSPELDEHFSIGLAVRAQDVTERPEILTGFGRALAKATVFCFENPEAGLQAMGEVVPEVLEDADASLELMALRMDKMRLPEEADGQWGWNSAERYAEQVDFLVDAGFVENQPEGEIWVGDAFLDEVNDFDDDAVEESARDS